MGTARGRGPARRSALVGAGLVLAGTIVAGMPSTGVAAPGDLDLGFGGASHGRVRFDMGTVTGLAVQPTGKLVVVGYEAQGSGFAAVAGRFKADGTFDGRFGVVSLPPAPSGADTSAVAEAVAVQPDGKIVVVGHVTDGGNNQDFAVWRLKASGALDTSFGLNGLVQFGSDATDDRAAAVALDAQGRIDVAGASASVGGADLGVLRVTSSGALDSTFNRGLSFFIPTHPGLDFARSVAVQADGQIVLGGFYEGASGNAVVRITPGSATTPATFDATFSGDGVADVPGTRATNDGDVAVTPDGHILMLDQVAANGVVDATVVRLTSSGVVDTSFGSATGTGAHIDVPGVTTTPKALTLLPHGGVIVVGSDDLGLSFVAKLRSTGMPDLRMGPGGVKTLAAHEDLVTVSALVDGRIVTAGNLGASSSDVIYRLRGDLRLPSCAGKKATIVGTRTADRLVGTGRPDVIVGLGGDDAITGLDKGDIVCGGGGKDHISGSGGADRLYGQTGADTLSGGAGRDRLIGGPGHDKLNGGPGRDTIRQ
jgi:uncharacterized delta-60 repeat protein